jgi:hypothetical protein
MKFISGFNFRHCMGQKYFLLAKRENRSTWRMNYFRGHPRANGITLYNVPAGMQK